MIAIIMGDYSSTRPKLPAEEGDSRDRAGISRIERSWVYRRASVYLIFICVYK